MRTIFPVRARVRAITSVAVIGAIVTGFTVSSFGRIGNVSSQLNLNAGTAWFADSTAGEVSLLDGATASRISEQPVGTPGDNVLAVQSGGQSGAGAYVVDRTTGDITRIDGETLQPGTPVRFSSPGDTSLALVSNATATWVVDQEGTLAEPVDPTTLA